LLSEPSASNTNPKPGIPATAPIALPNIFEALIPNLPILVVGSDNFVVIFSLKS